MKKLLLPFLLLFVNLSYSQPYPRKYLGVWISTVKMLDYPSGRNLNSDELKQEYIELLDFLDSLGINAIFFQVRPAADAFFPSEYEPWSEWLTGKQGRAPEPYFDPLQFMIEQAHSRGIQFHAWINPFRAIATIEYADVCKEHVTHQKNKWFFTYGLHKYFNPGLPEVRDYVTLIITDLVRRYDLDGIHFDDYYYPYPERDENHKIIPIPDKKTYRKYGKKNFKNIEDWRRDNINKFIAQVHDSIKAIDSSVIFGVSPPAVWRNKSRDTSGSATRGLAAYDWLYADILKWDTCGWVDYIAPQLYFPIGHKYADYATLLKWWKTHIHRASLFVGLNIQQYSTAKAQGRKLSTKIITEELKLADKYGINGYFFYRSHSLQDNAFGITDTLKNFFNAGRYFFPPLPTVDTAGPKQVSNIRVYKSGKDLMILWDPPLNTLSNDSTAFYAIYLEDTNKVEQPKFLFYTEETIIRVNRKHSPGLNGKKYKICITAFDKFHNEGAKSCIEFKVNKKDSINIAGLRM